MTQGMRYRSPRGALLGAAREALATPALVMVASFIGFGSLVRSVGLDLGAGMLSTAATWALPGQVVAVELYATGASLLVIALSVAAANMRLAPMIVSLMPHIRRPGVARWKYLLVAQVIAATSWFYGMRRCPELPEDQRLAYVAGYGATLWSATLLGTAVGYLAAGALPASVSLALVFLNPLYFMLLLLGECRHRRRAVAVGVGAVAGPALYLLTPEWSLPLAGLLGGTAAMMLTGGDGA